MQIKTQSFPYMCFASSQVDQVESRAAIELYGTVDCLACGLVHSDASCWLDIVDRVKNQLRVPCESQAHVGIIIYNDGLVS